MLRHVAFWKLLLNIERRQATVLVIDENEIVMETSALLLQGLGYQVLLAENGEEALARYGDQLDGIDLVIIDMVMPGMDPYPADHGTAAYFWR
jgi:CheY-like chemotaxis protein